MAKVKTLISKVYLLAGVIMTANMLVVDEIKAMDIDTKETEYYYKTDYFQGTEDNGQNYLNNTEENDLSFKKRFYLL